MQEYKIATSKSAGFKNPSSLYKYWKGAEANLSKEYLLLKFISINLFLQGVWKRKKVRFNIMSQAQKLADKMNNVHI